MLISLLYYRHLYYCSGQCLVRMNENSLMRLGIVHPEHRQFIWREIAKLRLRSSILYLRDQERRLVSSFKALTVPPLIFVYFIAAARKIKKKNFQISHGNILFQCLLYWPFLKNYEKVSTFQKQ